MQLKPGLVGTATLEVGEEQTAARLGSGRASVLATPIMIGLMEAAAVDCVERLLPEGQESLGVRVEVEHIAATPVGMAVTARAELKEIDRRALVFDVEARDARELIGRGRHVRVIVDGERFRAKVSAKAAGG
jgi:fluoroacetyl-CoA thioesterase